MKVYINTVRVNSNSVCGRFMGKEAGGSHRPGASIQSSYFEGGLSGYRSGVPPLA